MPKTEIVPKDLTHEGKLMCNRLGFSTSWAESIGKELLFFAKKDRKKQAAEYEKRIDALEKQLDANRAVGADLLDNIENAKQAMSETHHSWESRCHAIMAALGIDYGRLAEFAKPKPGTQVVTVDEIEKIILTTEPPGISDKDDKIWTRRMATGMAKLINDRFADQLRCGECQNLIHPSEETIIGEIPMHKTCAGKWQDRNADTIAGITPTSSVAFLTEAARYFENRPMNGEDSQYWSNVLNAENCKKAAALIQDMETILSLWQWKPIKDAPKDYLLILTCDDWPNTSKPSPVKIGGWDKQTGGWYIFGASWTPTHYMVAPVGPPHALKTETPDE